MGVVCTPVWRPLPACPVVDIQVHSLHALALTLDCAFLLMKCAVPVCEGIQLIGSTSSWDPPVHGFMPTVPDCGEG